MNPAQSTDNALPEDQLLPLLQMRQRIQSSLTRSANLAFLVTAGVSLLGCLLSLSMGILESSSGARALTWLGLAVAASIALLISKRKSPQWAIGWLAASSYLIIIGISIWVGLGVSSAASIAPVAVVVVIGFLNGPRMAMAATIVACLGSIGMLGLESAGMIPGLTASNKPPAALQTWIQCLVFVLVGMTTSCYSKLFWDAMLGLDQARVDLLAKIETQSRTQAALLESRQRLNALLDHVPMSVLILAPGTGRLHYANHHALSVHGVQSTEELESQCLFPPDSTFTRDSLRRAIATVHEQGSLQLRWPTRHASGREICWSASLHPSPPRMSTTWWSMVKTSRPGCRPSRPCESSNCTWKSRFGTELIKSCSNSADWRASSMRCRSLCASRTVRGATSWATACSRRSITRPKAL